MHSLCLKLLNLSTLIDSCQQLQSCNREGRRETIILITSVILVRLGLAYDGSVQEDSVFEYC